MNMAQREIERALQIVRKCGAERPGHARSHGQDTRLRSAIDAAPLVALGPDSTDQTAQARALADIDAAALSLEISLRRARSIGAITHAAYLLSCGAVEQVLGSIGS